MLATICTVMLVAAAPLRGQNADGIINRIDNAPLPEEQRRALSRAFSARDFQKLETILANAVGADAPPAHTAELDALLGAMEFVGERMSEAVQAFRQSDSRKPIDDSDRFTLAMALVTLGDIQSARVELTRLSEKHPDKSLYLYWLARLDYNQRLYEAAVEKLNRVIELDPESVRAYDNLGLSFDMMGLTDKAQDAFTKAVTLNRKLREPSSWPPENLGYLLLRLHQFHEAENSLREALKHDPQFALAHYHLGRVLENEARDEEAINEYKSAASLDPKLAEPLYSLGLLYRKLGRNADAKNTLIEYTRRKSSSDGP